MQLTNCKKQPSYYENLYAEAITSIEAAQIADLKKATAYGRQGNREMAMKYYNRVNDWYYLISFSTLILMEYSDAINNDKPVTMASLIKKYNTDCVRKQFACRGLDATGIFNLFGINADADLGISVMRIDGTAIVFTPHPITQPLD